MAVNVTTLTNISQQTIRLLYGKCSAENNVTKFFHSKFGELAIAPGTSASIETIRVDDGQIQSLQNKKLVTTTSH